MEWPWPRADPYAARTSAGTSPAPLGWYTAKGLPPVNPPEVTSQRVRLPQPSSISVPIQPATAVNPCPARVGSSPVNKRAAAVGAAAPTRFVRPPPRSPDPDTASMAAKVLQLRSSDGKVLVAPAWDYRPTAVQALPLEMRVPSRALERVLQYWTKHSLAKATGESRESLARWDADFERRLQEDGLTKEAAAAVQELRRYGVHHGGRPRRHAATAASDVAAPATVTRADPVRTWCQLVHHLRGVNHGERSPAPATSGAFDASDIAAAARPGPATTLPAAAGAEAEPVGVRCAIHARATASRARGRQMAEVEESTCHHRKRPASKACSSVGSTLCLPANAVAPVKKVSRPVASKACSFVGSTPLPVIAAAPGVKKVAPASTLRARRGMGELNCKIPKQNRIVAAASKKQPIPCLSPVVLRLC